MGPTGDRDGLRAFVLLSSKKEGDPPLVGEGAPRADNENDDRRDGGPLFSSNPVGISPDNGIESCERAIDGLLDGGNTSLTESLSESFFFEEESSPADGLLAICFNLSSGELEAGSDSSFNLEASSLPEGLLATSFDLSNEASEGGVAVPGSIGRIGGDSAMDGLRNCFIFSPKSNSPVCEDEGGVPEAIVVAVLSVALVEESNVALFGLPPDFGVAAGGLTDTDGLRRA